MHFASHPGGDRDAVSFPVCEPYMGIARHLKLLDYFGVGMPVVSTPIVSMLDMKNEVYVGDTVGELTEAIECALSESTESLNLARRKTIAREHTLENIAELLGRVCQLTASCGWMRQDEPKGKMRDG